MVTSGGKKKHVIKKAGILPIPRVKMAEVVFLEFEEKTLGLPGKSITKETVASFFNVLEDGLHLKVFRNGRTENVWPLSNGRFPLHPTTKKAIVIAFPKDSNDDNDFMQRRDLSLPSTSWNRSTNGLGKRTVPGLSFITKGKKKKAHQLKDFTFSTIDDEGQIAQLFGISINLTDIMAKFGHISVKVVCSALEQELRDQGEVVRLIILDSKGQPIMDSSETRKECFWTTQRTFRAMPQETFKKWKPRVWAAVNTGLYTVMGETDTEDESNVEPPTNQHLSVDHAQDEDTFGEIKGMFEEIKNSIKANKEVQKIKESFTCVICQSPCAASMYFCVTGCGKLIGCFYCASKVEDCPLCRVSLPDKEIRKPMSISGLADSLGIPEISMKSALKEASVAVDTDDDDIL